MKSLIKYFFAMLIFFFSCNIIYAECDDKTISNLKLQANNIEINYKYNYDLYNEDFDLEIVNIFDIYVTGLTNEMYLYVEFDGQGVNYYYDDLIDGILKINTINGGSTLKLIVYSTECNQKIKTINYTLPYYNLYSDDELCKQYADASVCSEFLDYDITYKDFKNKIDEYINKINGNTNSNDNNNLFSKLIDFIKNYYIYILISVGIVVCMVIGIIIHKKRGELN